MKKSEAIAAVHRYATSEMAKDMIALLDWYIQDARIYNDVVPKEELAYSQGRIAAFQTIRDNIINGVKVVNKEKS